MYIATVSDITDTRKAMMKMHKATRKMQLMESITYHDIFNQIQIMRGYMELMSSEPGRNENELRMFKAVEKAAMKISEQIKLLRDYYTIGLTEPDWMDLEEELMRAMDDSGLDPKTVTSRCNGIQILTDSSFYKAIYNLYHNSSSHGGKVTKVTIDHEQLPDGSLKLIYQDDGVGIPTSEKENIFERGFGKNTGLGMFLAREMLHYCGFSIRETGTHGARFEICVPPGHHRRPPEPRP